MNEPFVELVRMALDLMNRSFVSPDDPATWTMEFYHQFRKLWDRGIPVGLGLGHLVAIHEPGVDLAIQRLGEHGQPTMKFAAIQFHDSAAVPGFQHTIVIRSSPAVAGDVAPVIVFDPLRWRCV